MPKCILNDNPAQEIHYLQTGTDPEWKTCACGKHTAEELIQKDK